MEDEIKEFFKEPLKQHIVLGVKGFFRRANLIPNCWKRRIGATHELYTKLVDNSVQIQGLLGRMTGYWRADVEGGHKTGPHRTSLKAIIEYENTYINPFGNNSYQTAGFKKKDGNVRASTTMLSPGNIPNLQAIDLPAMQNDQVDINQYRVYLTSEVAKDACNVLYGHSCRFRQNEDGFMVASGTISHGASTVLSLSDAISLVPGSRGLEQKRGRRICIPCYIDTSDKDSARFIVIIHPGLEGSKIAACDARYPAN